MQRREDSRRGTIGAGIGIAARHWTSAGSSSRCGRAPRELSRFTAGPSLAVAFQLSVKPSLRFEPTSRTGVREIENALNEVTFKAYAAARANTAVSPPP
jgi:hypothetical protein